jgi:hypothetical protein
VSPYIEQEKGLVKNEAFLKANTKGSASLRFFFLNAHLTAHSTLVQDFIRDRGLFEESPTTILF